MQPQIAQKDIFGNTLNPNFVATPQPQQQQQQTPQGVHGRGGFLSSIISELGGAGGAAGGAALGASVGSIVPGIGTLIGGGLGAALGGFLGGTAGKGIEQKVRDNQNFFGAGGSAKKAFQEGGIDAALSGAGQTIGDVTKGLKAVKAGGTLAEALTGSGAQDLSRLQQASQAIKSSGTGALDTKAGIQGITNQAARLATVEQYGIKSGLPGLKQASALVGNLETKITPLLEKTSIPVNDAFAAIDSALSNTVNPVGKNGTTLAENLKNAILNNSDGNNISGNALRDIRGTLSDAFGKSTTTPITGLQKDMYHSLNGVLGDAAPKAKALIAEQSKLYNVADGLSTVAGGSKVVPFLPKSIAAGVVKSTAQDAAANVLGKAGAVTANPLVANLIRQAPGSLTRAVSGAANDAQNPVQNPQVDQQGNPIAQQPNAIQGFSGVQANQPQQSQYPISQALADIQRDPKNASTYLAINKAADAAVASQAKSVKLSSADQAKSDSLKTALASLQGAMTNLTAAGGAQGPKGNLSTLPVVGQYLDPQGASYHNTKIEMATQLAKAITGGSRVAQNVIDHYMKSLPDVNDAPAYAQAKVDKLTNELLAQARAFGLNDIIDQYSPNTQQVQGTGPSLQNILSQLGGQ